MSERNRTFLLILIMITVSLVVGGIAIHIVYGTAVEEERERFVEAPKPGASDRGRGSF